MSRAATVMSNAWDKNTYAKNLHNAQIQFNKMIRLEAADDQGFCVCVVTGKRIHYKAIDAGHFISATRAATRFDERNVHPQSKASNQFDTTNDSQIYYTIFMVETYGRDVVDELLSLKKVQKKWTKEEIIELRLDWAKRIKHHKKRLGL